MSEDDKTYLSAQREAVSKPGAPLQILPGTVLKGTYRIDAELGSGGMGTVFRATHIGLEKTMAVKVLSPRAIATPDSLARFEREAKVAGKVSHPAMTAVIDFGVEQGTPYIVMEYVNGAELAELIERDGPMSPRRAVAVMRQIVSLLRAAHALGIVHRDLKPANIKIIQETPEDSHIFVKVLDFGVAKIVGDISGQLTSEGMLVGTPAYMAPEQITGHPIDGRTDLYSAGLMFHEMLSGVRAFKGETIARILHAQMNDPPPPLTVAVPDIVRQTLQKFCEKRPEDRFQDAAEADRALTACEDVLRPPSVNVVSATVMPSAAEPERPESVPDLGAKTLAYQPKQAEPAPVSSSASGPGAAEAKPSSAVAVSDSLVREGQVAREKSPRAEPALVSAPKSVPAPVVPPLQPVEPKKSSGSGGVFLGVAGVVLVVVLAGGAWAWKTGRFAGQKGASSPAGVPPPSSEPPPQNKPVAVAEPPSTKEAPPGNEKNAQEEQRPATDTAPQAADNTPPAANNEPPVANNEPPAAETTPPPSQEPKGEGCFVSVVALESTRQSNGQFGPWLPKSVNSRTPVDCASVKAQKLRREYQDLFKKWPESSSEKVLQTQTLSFEPQKKGAPNTRRVVVKVHTRVSGSSPE